MNGVSIQICQKWCKILCPNSCVSFSFASNHLKFFTSICCSLFVDRLWRVRIIIAIAFYVHTENHLQESDSRPEPVFPPKFVLRSAWISFRVSLAQFFNFLGLIWYEKNQTRRKIVQLDSCSHLASNGAWFDDNDPSIFPLECLLPKRTVRIPQLGGFVFCNQIFWFSCRFQHSSFIHNFK